MRRAALALLLAASACRTVPPPPGAPRGASGAFLESVALAFPREGEGSCTATFVVSGDPDVDGVMGDVVWELWLEGRPFAAGVARPDAALPHGVWTPVAVTVPLLFRNVSWTGDARNLKVRLRGTLSRKFGGEAPRVDFDERRTVQSQGAPLFERVLR